MAGDSGVAAHLPHRRPGPSYRPRRPEATVLHRTVREHLEMFLARARDEERPVPRFVEREFRAYLDCGILACGFLRVHCDDCGRDRLVAFSCKGRGFCPSCGGRRMADTAAHLVDSVLPRVPVRQWVLTLPFALRYRLAFDAGLAAAVLGVFIRALFASLRRRARRRRSQVRFQCGAVTFVQRFGDALNLNVHFHTLVLDGVYGEDSRGGRRFLPLPPPETSEVEWVARRVARRLRRLLFLRGLGPDADPALADPLPADEPLLATLYGASVRSRIALGKRAGQRVLRFGDGGEAKAIEKAPHPRCVTVEGFSVHAQVGVPARDRRRLEKLCRYMGRPPVSSQRLSLLPDGRLLYRLKRRWRDGTTHVAFEPLEFLEKLAALVPPPRVHQVRYHGVLGPAAGGRGSIVPAARPLRVRPRAAPEGAPPSAFRRLPLPASGPGTPPHRQLPPGGRQAPKHAPQRASQESLVDLPVRGDLQRPPLQHPLRWSELIRRVFAVDVLKCPRCGGGMRVLAAIQDPESIRAILAHLGLPARAPPLPAERPWEAPPPEPPLHRP